MKRLLFLFLFWELFYIPIALKEAMDFFQNNHFSFYSVVKYFFLYTMYDNKLTGWVASWYLLALFWALPVFCFMVKHLDERIVFCLCFLIEIYYVISNGYKTVFCIQNPISPLFFPRTLIYLYIGYYLTKAKKNQLTCM